jgi:hypothetical protein
LDLAEEFRKDFSSPFEKTADSSWNRPFFVSCAVFEQVHTSDFNLPAVTCPKTKMP